MIFIDNKKDPNERIMPMVRLRISCTVCNALHRCLALPSSCSVNYYNGFNSDISISIISISSYSISMKARSG